jgi:hypothetical protein
MQVWLESLRRICDSHDVGRLVVALKQIVQDYNPSADLLERVIAAREPRHAAIPIP